MSELPPPTIGVIVLLYKNAVHMPALFEGMVASDYPRERVTVHLVDNNPGDGSLDEAKRQMERFAGRLPPFRLHEPGRNTGFTGGNNLVMRELISGGTDYCYLLNGDAAFEPSALREAVAVAESDPMIGAVQSLLVLRQNPHEINSTGNAIHYLGFGYCVGYHLPRSSAPTETTDIAYASGAGVLLRSRVLAEVGIFDETFMAYHEDLDLGWRILLAGYRNVLAPKSVVRHYYEFSRSISKWFWMERNRIAVVLKNYRWATVLLLLPQLIVADIGLFLFALRGGWGKEMLRASVWFLKPSTWTYLWRGRREIARIRKVPDRAILKRFTSVIAYQEFESPFIKAAVNPAWRFLFAITRALVRW